MTPVYEEHWDPNVNLWRAVLIQEALDAIRGIEKARRWLHGENPFEGCLEGICECAEVEPGNFRRRVEWACQHADKARAALQKSGNTRRRIWKRGRGMYNELLNLLGG
jgi:hypothetical protein